MANELGRIRQSGVIMNYGPGAIIDFRLPGSGAAVSVVAAGLEQWEATAERADIPYEDLKRFVEPRLAEKLGVKYFRLAPVSPDKVAKGQKPDFLPLTGVRFPRWLQCPRCGTMKKAARWGRDPGDPARRCPPCSMDLPGKNCVHVVPVRFIMACRNGHLDDFPWSWWVHRGTGGCSNDSRFRMTTEGAGLAGMVVECPKCNQRRSMEGVFEWSALKDFGCSGARPWLPDGTENCGMVPSTMQRGASNLYFPRFETALAIPPWSDRIWNSLGTSRDHIMSAESDDDVRLYVRKYLWKDRPENRRGTMALEEFEEVIVSKRAAIVAATTSDIRWDEYCLLTSGDRSVSRNDEGFVIRPEEIGDRIPGVSGLVRVESVREIRVLTSFTRIEAYPGREDMPVRNQFLSRTRRPWLPAVEVRGEGVFMVLDPDRVNEWSSRKDVQVRAAAIRNPDDSVVLNPESRAGGWNGGPELVARYLLVHSLSHVLMKQLSLQCGYSSASLRERLFVGGDDRRMTGLMIYTATSDADGTLGGLQREGKPDKFVPMFEEAIRGSEWCSSDPLCIQDILAATEPNNLAACHGCLLAPETSCEDYNRFLDRAMLVGTPENPAIGYFSDPTGRAGEV